MCKLNTGVIINFVRGWERGRGVIYSESKHGKAWVLACGVFFFIDL